ncbi:ABC transporter permease [Chitinophaga sp. S165]|uniref:ABC transporter permease n=1 Tax=Chitinophaga sp. S165 TaxID=2135462 RepID=UPI000D70F056|nr:ABC transporter permease [Chitinophaga sp. S165]PWV56080.1 MacB-like protein [Chitinophaga sp. S165]
MLANYLRISFRHLWKNRTSTTINIIGLTVGLSCGILIFLLVSYLFSFDRYHHKADRTYWIVTDIHRENTLSVDATPRALGAMLRQDYPFVENAVRLENLFGRVISIPGTSLKFEESRNICFTETQFFDVFDVQWLHGNKGTALSSPNTVVLSERYAQKYFGSTDVIGRTLRFDNQQELTVTGVIGNPPSNTKLGYEVMVSYPVIKQTDWGSTRAMCFVALRNGASPQQLTKALSQVHGKYLSAGEAKLLDFKALPLSELNHNTQYGGAVPRPLLYILIAIGVLLVLAACINFINMATAQAINRAKETGIRKAIGSTRTQLILQFLTETGIVTLLAVVISLVVVQLNLPMLNNALSVIRADISVLWLFRPDSLGWFIGLILAVILLAGLYPSIVLTRFSPIAVIHGRIAATKTRGVTLRKTLVVTQFFITQFFIIAVIVMTAQVRYIQRTDLGFRKEAILTVAIPASTAIKQQTLRQQLSQVPGVEQVSLGLETPASRRNDPNPFTYENNNAGFPANVKIGDTEYASLFGLHFLAGRNFMSNDTLNAEAIVTTMLVKQLGLASPDDIIGKRINIWGQDKTVIGVVDDFHSQDLHHAVKPVILLNYPSENRMVALKLHPGASIAAIEQAWNAVYPEQVFHMTFVDDVIAQFYLVESILLGLIQVFSFVAILIGCLGLYGLVLFIAAARNKEIGVRKVFGASITSLTSLLMKDFIRLVGIGIVIATPLAYMAMNKWLQGFAYRVNISWWMPGLAGALIVGIAMLTVGWESLKAASKDPVKVLKAD